MQLPATAKLLFVIISCCLLLSGCAAMLAPVFTPVLTPTVASKVSVVRPGQYALDQRHATLLFKIQHFRLSTYVGRFNKFDASLDFDPENIGQASLEAVIEMASLDINDSDLRDQLLGSKWFDQARHPQARLTTVSLNALEDQQFELLANLEWRGVTKPISLLVNFNGGAKNPLSRKYTIGFSATGSLLRSDFGIRTYFPIVGDKVELEIYAEFQKN